MLKLKLEDIFYTSLYIGSLSYASFEFYRFGEVQKIADDDFIVTNGWSILSRKRLEYDFNYERFLHYFENSISWLLFHCVFCELVRFINSKYIPLAHAIIGFLYVCFYFKITIVVIFITSILLYYSVVKITVQKSYVWLTTISLLILNSVLMRESTDFSQYFTQSEFFDVIVPFSWQLTRLTSFALTYCDEKRLSNESLKLNERFSLINYLAYGFYLPIFMHGPTMIYSGYLSMIEQNKLIDGNSDSLERSKNLLKRLLQLWAIYLLKDLMLHFLYTEAVYYDRNLLQKLKGWSLYGYLFWVQMYFELVYMIKYGLGIALARFDRVEAPKPGACFATLNLSSRVWRYCDRGLYEFLLKHIYVDVKSSCIPKFARAISFGFIFMWHSPGGSTSSTYWVIANFIALNIEVFGKYIAKTQFYSNLSFYIGAKNMKRVVALLGGQLLLATTITAILFVCGTRITLYIATETYLKSSWLSYATLTFVMYSIFHVGEFFHQRRIANKL